VSDIDKSSSEAVSIRRLTPVDVALMETMLTTFGDAFGDAFDEVELLVIATASRP
jgi:hypothetical protein